MFGWQTVYLDVKDGKICHQHFVSSTYVTNNDVAEIDLWLILGKVKVKNVHQV